MKTETHPRAAFPKLAWRLSITPHLCGNELLLWARSLWSSASDWAAVNRLVVYAQGTFSTSQTKRHRNLGEVHVCLSLPCAPQAEDEQQEPLCLLGSCSTHPDFAFTSVTFSLASSESEGDQRIFFFLALLDSNIFVLNSSNLCSCVMVSYFFFF